MKSAPEAQGEEGEREREEEREQEKWQGRDVGVVFCFFATGYIYNYLAGIEWPRGFFNKGRRHIQYRILPTDQRGTREGSANGIRRYPECKVYHLISVFSEDIH